MKPAAVFLIVLIASSAAATTHATVKI